MASSPTAAEVRARLEAIFTALTAVKTVITVEDQALTAAQLPAVIVMLRGATREKTAAGLYQMTRTWACGVLIARLQTWTEAEQRAQLLAAEAFIETVPDHFARLDRLELNRQPLRGVWRVGLMSDGGLETREFGKFSPEGNLYYAVTYSLDVTTSR